MSTQVTLVYTVNAVGQTVTHVETTIAVPPVDPAMLALLGVTVSSDTVAAVGNAVTRTIVLALTAAFHKLFPAATSDERAPFWNIMTNILARAVGSPVLAAAPVLA